MFIIDMEKIKPGDILLIKNDSEISEIIRRESNSNYSHASIFWNQHSCLESDNPIVATVNPQRLHFKNIEDAKLLRLRDTDSLQHLSIGLQIGLQKVGTSYASLAEVRKSIKGTNEPAKENNREFCTRYVARIYSDSNLPIVENPDYCTAREIENSSKLIEIEDVLITVSDEYLQQIKERKDTVSIQTDAIAVFLQKVREITNIDIQNFEAVDEYLINNPKHDTEIAQALKETDFLNLGDIERESNPNVYDINLFLKSDNEENLYRFANAHISEEMNRIISFRCAIEKYSGLAEEHKSKYFLLLKECFMTQLLYSIERYKVFSDVKDMFE